MHAPGMFCVPTEVNWRHLDVGESFEHLLPAQLTSFAVPPPCGLPWRGRVQAQGEDIVAVVNTGPARVELDLVCARAHHLGEIDELIMPAVKLIA